jgi:hypothetical protein
MMNHGALTHLNKIEASLWEAADQLRANSKLTSSEYCMPVLAIFDLMQKTPLAATERERIKQSSRELLAELLRIIAPLDQWTEKEQTRAEVETVILDRVFLLPEPPYTPADKDSMAKMLYQPVWQQSMGGQVWSVGYARQQSSLAPRPAIEQQVERLPIRGAAESAAGAGADKGSPPWVNGRSAAPAASPPPLLSARQAWRIPARGALRRCVPRS